jgi:hypothetical protein
MFIAFRGITTGAPEECNVNKVLHVAPHGATDRLFVMSYKHAAPREQGQAHMSLSGV